MHPVGVPPFRCCGGPRSQELLPAALGQSALGGGPGKQQGRRRWRNAADKSKMGLEDPQALPLQ